MAVQPQTPYIEHIANDTTTGFNLGFDCDDQDHLIVKVDDVEPSVGSWSLTGSAVVFGAAPIPGSKITIQRNTPFSRTVDYQSYNNSFHPPAVNKDFDWIWLKLQELGVADWILSNRIDALKNYVDDRDDELRAYLMEEIRKQGVALDQLDDYYNYLMQRLAQIAVDKGWDASFVVDGNKNQKQINEEQLNFRASQQEVNNELYVFRKPVVYAKNLKTDETDQLSELNALAAEAVSKRLTLILPQGTICISDEFIPPDGLKLEGLNADSVNSTFDLNGTTIKWIGVNGANKAVIRASRSAIGVTPTAPVNAVSLKGFYVDANACDCGVYFRNFTNEGYAGEIVVRNSKKVGIAGVQMWFSRLGALTAAANQNVGICFGEPMFGEVGSGGDGLDVNAIPFSYLRAHSNGRDNTYVDNATYIRRGAGIILKTRSCSFASIQSEKNYGVGLIELASSRTNSYSAIYLEGNCNDAPTERIGLLNYSNNLNIQSIYLSVGEKFRNMASELMTIQNGMKDGSESPFSASNVGGLWYGGVSSTFLLNATNAEFESFVYSVISNIAIAQDVDINYSSAKPFGTKTFYVPRTINGAYLVIAPRSAAAAARTIVYNLDGTTRNANASAFTAGAAQKFTVGTLTKGFHTLSIADPGSSDLLNCDVYIMNAVLPSGYSAKSFPI